MLLPYSCNSLQLTFFNQVIPCKWPSRGEFLQQDFHKNQSKFCLSLNHCNNLPILSTMVCIDTNDEGGSHTIGIIWNGSSEDEIPWSNNKYIVDRKEQSYLIDLIAVVAIFPILAHMSLIDNVIPLILVSVAFYFWIVLYFLSTSISFHFTSFDMNSNLNIFSDNFSPTHRTNLLEHQFIIPTRMEKTLTNGLIKKELPWPINGHMLLSPNNQHNTVAVLPIPVSAPSMDNVVLPNAVKVVFYWIVFCFWVWLLRMCLQKKSTINFCS